MKFLSKVFSHLTTHDHDEQFLGFLEALEVTVAKVLSLAMIGVILASIFDLLKFLFLDLLNHDNNTLFKNTLFEIFGLFLNVLIALEILENITAYLKKQALQVELVIVTSLIAVARKIIILDLEKKTGIDLIGLAVAVFALSVSYGIIRLSLHNNRNNH
jgi:uncharacterized membrane protein (DUF373 family)